MRVFLAVALDAAVRGRLAELECELRPLAPRARWVRPEGLHLTLRFFGEVPAEGVESLATRLEDAFAGLPAFALEFRGCGVFPDRGNPRVLWAGIPGGRELRESSCVSSRAGGITAEGLV